MSDSFLGEVSVARGKNALIASTDVAKLASEMGCSVDMMLPAGTAIEGCSWELAAACAMFGVCGKCISGTIARKGGVWYAEPPGKSGEKLSLFKTLFIPKDTCTLTDFIDLIQST